MSAYVHLARTLYAQRRLEDAASALEASLHLDPVSAGSQARWEMAADVYHELSRSNLSYAQRAIACCRSSLRIDPTATSTWTNLAKVLGEVGRHDEALDATLRAVSLHDTFTTAYQHAEALTAAGRRAEAQSAYRSLLQRQDAQRHSLADVYSHLAISLLATAAERGERMVAAVDALLPANGVDGSTGMPSRDATSLLDEAMLATRAALRLNPNCAYTHAHNYYQVFANQLHARGRLDLATAALWPVAAMAASDGSHLSEGPAGYLRAGFHALARQQSAEGDAGAVQTTREVLRWLGAPWDLPAFQRVKLPDTDSSASTAAASHSTVSGVVGAAGGVSPRWEARLRAAREKRTLEQTLVARHADLTVGFEAARASGQHDDEGQARPQSARPSGVIVYLCCADEAELLDLRRSVRYLFQFFNGNPAARYPVVIFHDMLNSTQEHHIQSEAVAALGPTVRSTGLWAGDRSRASPLIEFQRLGASEFAIPMHIRAEQRARIPASVRGYGMGYRHMCRFFSGPGLFAHPAIATFEFVWRLDSDSFLLDKPTADPFRQMAAANASYAWIHAYRDDPMFVTGLWEETKAFLTARGISEAFVHRWLPGGATWPMTPMCFATNCFLARRSWFLSDEYLAYFRALDAAGGFYIYRWGDACVHMLAVAALLPLNRVLHLTSLAYWHQGTVILPRRLHRVASDMGLAGEVPKSMFAQRPEDDAWLQDSLATTL